MSISAHLAGLRAKIGNDLLTLTAAAVAVFDARDCVLLGRSTQTGMWMLPGGAIDPEETPADAAVRECWEETGLLVMPVRLIGVFGGPSFCVKYANGDAVCYTTIAFVARTLEGTLNPDASEFDQLGYYGSAEWRNLPLADHSVAILDQAHARWEAPYFAPATWRP